ncbi:MAG: FAD-binding oxidoreductase [Rhizobiales bacterium]|nr:FAD-binding oxidoreductase [Hyphomicrobiales bacterium]MBO6700426.1 FAD-binding oxidoreductase [Hyphomicrobiales bacterium]MBO6737962.1 FAD-binding oxidoreductase [Hyphomicrobiales bacterium]MBO6913731.1 FAD-binding oxidoreductase [Hyphomicrobiales bacterium]MBO6954374.1 FAD-binding oxidoreductase [Hyphomicrobiales bacterium]
MLADTVKDLTQMLGDQALITDPDDQAPFLHEWRDRYVGKAAAVVQPRTVDEVCQVLRFAHENGVPVVPQGGNTGLVGGQTPDQSGNAILLSLAKLNRVREVDPVGGVITVDAGVVLQTLQEEADKAGRLFPLSLGAEGSCMIGGNLSTNAGGTGVLAYGNTRDLVLGLEVALPDGRLWNGLSKLRKDNTGYDLKHLFIGAEGTLGVITGASLKLFPKPKGMRTAMIGVASPHEALKLFSLMQEVAGPSLTAFEIMPRIAIDFLTRNMDGMRDPLEGEHAWYVLAEISSGRGEDDAEALLMQSMETSFEDGLVEDAVIAQSLEQANMFWAMRHGLSEAQKPEGGSIKHDVSVPVAAVADFLDEAIAAVVEMVPGCRPVPFGHLGDGNIHFNVSQPEGADRAAFLANYEAMNERVHAITTGYGGSISAEHGIGQAKRDLLPGVKDPVALALMRTLKDAIDLKGIMNPGKVLAKP